MNRTECLEKAMEIVNGARQENYGKPENNFLAIATLWSDYLTFIQGDTEIHLGPTDVANMMILMKVARLINKPTHLDSWVDIAGYAANGSEVCGA